MPDDGHLLVRPYFIMSEPLHIGECEVREVCRLL